jgi:hypothetical protein
MKPSNGILEKLPDFINAIEFAFSVILWWNGGFIVSSFYCEHGFATA